MGRHCVVVTSQLYYEEARNRATRSRRTGDRIDDSKKSLEYEHLHICSFPLGAKFSSLRRWWVEKHTQKKKSGFTVVQDKTVTQIIYGYCVLPWRTDEISLNMLCLQVTHAVQNPARIGVFVPPLGIKIVMNVTAHELGILGQIAQHVSVEEWSTGETFVPACFTSIFISSSPSPQPSSSPGSKYPWSRRPTLYTTFSPTSRVFGTSSTTSPSSGTPSWDTSWPVSYQTVSVFGALQRHLC